ncbi:glucose-6-phosphate 1-dehydrogenase [Oscillochloris trichoides DG-6]|uniref:Glucose-6-phosphate 1-dehydrogenase n=1 Tax=Oscillochloris trichoides DG-6 TaxID=765420 RepID=E1IEW1_9CHLR|nr:glucose-6-phosphate dehydrogenase [Oscillochloris trichoides]EFO80258.1 glucose-6-phosphate 1-dehydrogenase [Oscillochloris trichoides DG-6]
MQPTPPISLVIFGASGDLTQRKLIPALFQLCREGLLPGSLRIIGYARRAKSDAQFRAEQRAGVVAHGRVQPIDAEAWEGFAANLFYHAANFDDPQGFISLRERIEHLETEAGVAAGHGHRLFYLATPPEAYPGIVSHLGAAGLQGATLAQAGSHGWTRIVIEKPFGHDLASAEALNAHVLSIFHERQVYRIDHYLGKETVQNILAFRLGNSIFEPLWKRGYIDHVQITVAEAIGVEGRGGYYESAGAIRDMLQNHMLQVLALIAMEPPATFSAEAVRNEKVKVLQAIRSLAHAPLDQLVVRGQYAGYHAEPGVAPTSNTETFVALRLQIDNWRWAGVPFYLRTGKALQQRLTEVAIQFRQPPLALFSHADHDDHVGPADEMEPNMLVLRIQPDEAITLQIGLKPPGPEMALRPVALDFRYAAGFTDPHPEAYERLLLDVLLGDATLFIRRDEVEAAWALITPILEHWANPETPPPALYPPGSWGPDAAHELIGREGRRWRS